MAKFKVTVRESASQNQGVFIYTVEATTKCEAMIQGMDDHRMMFNLWDGKLEASARCVRTEAA